LLDLESFAHNILNAKTTKQKEDLTNKILETKNLIRQKVDGWRKLRLIAD
jgi:hypothetical protein